MTYKTMDYHNAQDVRNRGLAALERELGPVGTIYFMRQYATGSGNYTEDRHEWLDDVSLDEVFAGAEAFGKWRHGLTQYADKA